VIVKRVSRKNKMTAFTQACIAANREVSHLLKDQFDPSLLQKNGKGAGGDISSEADLLAEAIFVKYLGQFGTIESEESGVIGEGVPTIIIDPLDGSANFASGFPYYGTSVAQLDEEGKMASALVCNLVSGEFFLKEEGGSLQKGHLSREGLEKIKKETSSPQIGLFEKAYAYPMVVSGLLESGYKFRSPGATALSLAYAHSVNFFLFIGPTRIYDVVAGLALSEGLIVIVEEEYVIVSQSKSIAENIESIIRRSLV